MADQPPRRRSKQSFVFVTSVNTTRLSRQKQRAVRQQSQLSRYSPGLNEQINERLRQASESVQRSPGFLPDWQLERFRAASRQSISSQTSDALIQLIRSPSSASDSSTQGLSDSPVTAPTPSSASTSSSPSPALPPAVGLLGDPFRATPLPHVKQADRLIWYYLHDQYPAKFFGEAANRESALDQRRTIWMPIALSEMCAYSALLGFLFVSPRTPEHLRNEKLARHCLSITLTMLRERLRSHQIDDVTLYSVGMLEFASWLLNDQHARIKHHHGFLALLAFRNNLIIDKLGFAKSTFDGVDEQSPDDSAKEYLFVELYEKGLVSQDLSQPFRYMKTKPDFCLLASRDPLAGPFLLNHVPSFSDPRQGHRTTTHADILDNACQATMLMGGRMIFNQTGYSGPKTEDSVRRVSRGLFQAAGWQEHLQLLWRECPAVLLWLALMNGTATRVDVEKRNFCWVLWQSRITMKLKTYDDTVQLISRLIRWPDIVGKLCEDIWTKVDKAMRSSHDGHVDFGSDVQREYELWLRSEDRSSPTLPNRQTADASVSEDIRMLDQFQQSWGGGDVAVDDDADKELEMFNIDSKDSFLRQRERLSMSYHVALSPLNSSMDCKVDGG